MDDFDNILKSATTDVENPYFLLNIAGGNPIFRERVYCYELYHQMRKRWPPSQFIINAEIDKRAHPILTELGADQKKPDMLIHKPGTMENYAIIEVKYSTRLDGIKKDLETLDLFCKKVGYKRAIYLIYGSEASDGVVRKIISSANDLGQLSPIEVWLHQEVGHPAIHKFTLYRTEFSQSSSNNEGERLW